ncbi:hypothetical protein [Micromonospora sp. CA-246542]|uniref:hypothetical protein n=1 Tax=Micromonospora sp. CA-246542 TaxID=3239959 RepID=UPI003D92449F
MTMILLMAFSIVSWLLGNTTMAAVAGMGVCTLAADAIRRYLGVAAEQGHRPPEAKASDPGRDDE